MADIARIFLDKEKLRYYYETYERRVSSIAFLFGFAMDNLTLTRVDLLFDNLVLFLYLTIAAVSIAAYNAWTAAKLRGKFFETICPWLPLVMQFAFGGLFSGFVVFYAKSASFISSWPFLLMLAFLLIGNEFFKKRYEQFVFQVSIFFIALFSFAIFFLPVAVKTFGAGTFVASGLVSLVAVALFVRALLPTLPAGSRNKRALFYSIAGIYALMHVLYVTNIIPPIPLALKEAGVYASIVRAGGEYVAMAEPQPWYAAFIRAETYHAQPGESLVFFSAVFAPTKLSTAIVHTWQYYNEAKKTWEARSRVQFGITGGRDGGYRGYSIMSRLAEGIWRVRVETPRGQQLGQKTFRVKFAPAPKLEEVIL